MNDETGSEGEIATRDATGADAEVIPGPATREDYAEAICESYRDTVEGIFRMGDLLLAAKDDLPHGEFESMVEEDLPFGPRTARRLMAIARDGRLRNRTRVSDLPPAWSTLYALTRLDRWEWAAVEPHISPELTRGEVKDKAERRSRVRREAREAEARREIEDSISELPKDERDRARDLLGDPDVSVLTRARVARKFHWKPWPERLRLYRLNECDARAARKEAAVQAGLRHRGTPRVGSVMQVSHDAREELATSKEESTGTARIGPRWTREDREAEVRPVLSLISLLRWFFAFIDRTEDGAVEAGLWAVRNPAGLAADARRVAVWMTRFAARLERGERRAARRSELPEPHLVVSVDGPHPHSHVGRRRSRSAPEAAASR